MGHHTNTFVLGEGENLILRKTIERESEDVTRCNNSFLKYPGKEEGKCIIGKRYL